MSNQHKRDDALQEAINMFYTGMNKILTERMRIQQDAQEEQRSFADEIVFIQKAFDCSSDIAKFILGATTDHSNGLLQCNVVRDALRLHNNPTQAYIVLATHMKRYSEEYEAAICGAKETGLDQVEDLEIRYMGYRFCKHFGKRTEETAVAATAKTLECVYNARHVRMERTEKGQLWLGLYNELKCLHDLFFDEGEGDDAEKALVLWLAKGEVVDA